MFHAAQGETRGDPPLYVMRTSAYTRAGLHPFATAGIVALALGGTAALILR
jgi:hypothetical protein